MCPSAVTRTAGHAIFDRIGSRLENLLGRSLLQCLAVHGEDIVQNAPLEKFLVKLGLFLLGLLLLRNGFLFSVSREWNINGETAVISMEKA